MNAKTKETLKRFVEQLQNLTQEVVLTIGIDSASRIMDSAEALKDALDKDETIL